MLDPAGKVAAMRSITGRAQGCGEVGFALPTAPYSPTVWWNWCAVVDLMRRGSSWSGRLTRKDHCDDR